MNNISSDTAGTAGMHSGYKYSTGLGSGTTSWYAGGHADSTVVSDLLTMYLSGLDITVEAEKYLSQVRRFSWVGDNNLRALETFTRLKKLWNV